MHNSVLADPAHKMIIVDGLPLSFSYASPYPMKTLRWKNQAGRLDFENTETLEFGQEQYEQYVVPFVALWEAETAARDALRRPSPAEARVAAFSALREKRKSVEYGGFAFQGQRWDSEEKDELRLNSALKMFDMTGMEAFPGWKVAEGVYITATLELLQGAALSMMQHYAGAFAVEAAKTAELEALAAAEGATAADIEAWIAGAMREGWPG